MDEEPKEARANVGDDNDASVLLEVLQMAASVKDTQHMCQILSTASGLVQHNADADRVLAAGGLYTYALRLCDRYKDEPLRERVYRLLEVSGCISDACLALLAKRVIGMQGSALRSSHLAQEALVSQICKSEVWRAQYGQDILAVLLEKTLMPRGDGNQEVWARWTQEMLLLTAVVSQPSICPSFQEQALPVAEALFEEGILLRAELSRATRLACCTFAAAVTSNNVKCQEQLGELGISQSTSLLETLLRQHVRGQELAPLLEFLEGLIICKRVVAEHLAADRLFIHLITECADQRAAKDLLDTTLETWLPESEAECKVAIQAIQSHPTLPSEVKNRWSLGVRRQLKKSRAQNHARWRAPLPLFFPNSRTFTMYNRHQLQQQDRACRQESPSAHGPSAAAAQRHWRERRLAHSATATGGPSAYCSVMSPPRRVQAPLLRKRTRRKPLQSSLNSKQCTFQQQRGLRDNKQGSNVLLTGEGEEKQVEGEVAEHSVRERKKQRRVEFTPQEDEFIQQGVKRFGRRWENILAVYAFHPSRTAPTLMKRYDRVLNA